MFQTSLQLLPVRLHVRYRMLNVCPQEMLRECSR